MFADSEKYFTSPENVLNTLSTYGVAIIPQLLSEDECEKMMAGMWQTLGHLTSNWESPIVQSDPKSWRQIRDLFPMHSMLIQHHSIGHAQYIWDLRQNPKCINVFANIWNTQELLCSFDGVSYHFPPEVTNIGWRRNIVYHCDQSFVDSSFKCVQSWVTALDVEPGDATLTFLEGSHRLHEEFGQHAFETKSKDDWYKLTDENLQFYLERGCEQKFITCPKGSMVLWDSRTIHTGTEAVKGRLNPKIRSVAYLCYTPHSLATPKELEKKCAAFNNMRMTTHWPHKIKLFAKNPRTYGATVRPLVALSPPILTDVGLRLAGF